MPHANEYELEDRDTLHRLQKDILEEVLGSAYFDYTAYCWIVTESDMERLGHALKAIERCRVELDDGLVMRKAWDTMRAALISRIRVCEGKRE